jgi:ribosomal protein S18 acetylase RimI-like enzyme
MKIQDTILRIQGIEEKNIVTAMEENFYSYISAISCKTNNILFESNQLLLIDSGVVSRLLLPSNEERAKYIINSIKKYLSIPLLWCIEPRSKPDNLADLLRDCGCNVESVEKGMFLNLQQHKDILIPTELSISLVASIDLLDDFTQVLAEYWDIPDMNKRNDYMKVGSILLHPQFPIKLYIGYFHEKPVAICELLLKNGIAGIYSVTTAQKMRHRGFATTILLASLMDARQQGYEIATVQATSTGEKLYSRLGFKELCMFYKYRSP